MRSLRPGESYSFWMDTRTYLNIIHMRAGSYFRAVQGVRNVAKHKLNGRRTTPKCAKIAAGAHVNNIEIGSNNSGISVLTTDMYRHQACHDVVIFYAFESGLLHHVTQCILVRMDTYRLGEIPVTVSVIGHDTAERRQHAK